MDKNKIIEQNLSDSIKMEVQLMRQINHPYIVKLVEVMATAQKILLVMEYVDGGDLFDAISNN
jgi:serine/threonine protein kinase